MLSLSLGLFADAAPAPEARKTLQIYFVDVEGGQSTLFVTPEGRSLLVDTGWPGNNGRDADRIVAAAKAAGIQKIDYVLITHFHEDHVGGLPQLVARIPVSTFVDHGPRVTPAGAAEPTPQQQANLGRVDAAYADARAKGRHIEVKAGWRIFVRPIRPEDEPLIHDFLHHVTPQDLRLRFFAPMKEFTHEFIARLTQLDYARAMAFVAFDEVTNGMVGVVRIHSDSVYESGEYAILLRSDLKGKGLGWVLMQLIIEYARSEGLKVISGDVLRENTVMLEMCRNLGFEVSSNPAEHGICEVRLKL